MDTNFSIPIIEVLCVLDGNTVEAEIDPGFGNRKVAIVRLRGIGTPQLHDPAQARAAMATKNAVEKWIADRRGELWLMLHEWDRQGRAWGDIVKCGKDAILESLGTWLRAEGYARFRDGGTKNKWTDEELTRIENRGAEEARP